jgi:hypothetical protein
VAGVSRSRCAARVRAWARHTFSREQLWSSAKSFAWVAPLSILIWVYAEQTFRTDRPNQPIPFTIRTNDPRQLVTMISRDNSIGDTSIMATLEGPRAALDNVVSHLVPERVEPRRRDRADESKYRSGEEYAIEAARIRDTDMFKNSGVVVSAESPPTLRFRIDQLVDQAVDVRPSLPPETFASPPLFEKSSVRVMLPKRLLDGLGGEPLVAYADLSRFDEVRTPGAHTLTNVPVVLGNDSLRQADHVTITPDRVTAKIDVKNAERQSKIDSVPIFVSGPPTLLREVPGGDGQAVHPERPDQRPTRRDRPDRQRNVRRPLKAELEVTADDVLKGRLPRAVRIEIQDVKVLGPPEAERTVTFELIENGTPANSVRPAIPTRPIPSAALQSLA